MYTDFRSMSSCRATSTFGVPSCTSALTDLTTLGVSFCRVPGWRPPQRFPRARALAWPARTALTDQLALVLSKAGEDRSEEPAGCRPCVDHVSDRDELDVGVVVFGSVILERSTLYKTRILLRVLVLGGYQHWPWSKQHVMEFNVGFAEQLKRINQTGELLGNI